MDPLNIINNNRTKLVISKGEMHALDRSIKIWKARSQGKRNRQRCPLCQHNEKVVNSMNAISVDKVCPCGVCIITKATSARSCNNTAFGEWLVAEKGEEEEKEVSLKMLNQLKAIKSICTTEDS